MTTKTPRKVALIDVRDCPRCDYAAYWQISVTGDEREGYLWRAKLISYEPVGYEWQGRLHSEWPAGVPAPVYPSDAHLARQGTFLTMAPEERRREELRQEAFRAQCAAIYEAAPKPVHLIDETLGTERTREAADTAAQEWVRARMPGQRRQTPGARVHGYAVPLPLDLVGEALRGALDDLRYLWRRFARPLLALAYASAVRDNMLQQIINAMDAGAGPGLWRIYNGTRPASCGTATTLGAELTLSDPSATKTGGVLTFSAITPDASANASITASWFRIVDSTGTCVIDGNVGTSGSDLNLNSTTITVGQEVSITAATITEGNA